MCVDRIERAERIDQRSSGVHGHSDAERFGNFLLRSAGFERSIGVKRDAAVAARGYGKGE